MKNAIRIFIIVIVLAFAVSLISCQIIPQTSTTTTTKPQDPPTEDELKVLELQKFISLVDNLPTVELYGPSREKDLAEALMQYDYVVELYGDEYAELLESNKDFKRAVYELIKLSARKIEVDAIVDAANIVNSKIADQKDFEIKFNRESAIMIDELKALVEEWEEKYNIITEAHDMYYNPELYNLIDRATIEGYNSKLEAHCAGIKMRADAFIDAVDNLEVITPDSKSEFNAAKDSYVKFIKAAGDLSPFDVDYILGYGSDDGVVAAWNNYVAKLTTYNNIIAAIKYVEDGIKSVMKDDAGVSVLDETKLTSLDQTGIDAKLVALLGTYKLDETVIDAYLLAIYKTARLYDEIAIALANVDTAYATATNASKDAQKAVLVTLVERAAKKAYTFEVELVCTCPEDSEEECECNVYKLVDDAATKALAVFTKDHCNGFFAEVVEEEEEEA